VPLNHGHHRGTHPFPAANPQGRCFARPKQLFVPPANPSAKTSHSHSVFILEWNEQSLLRVRRPFHEPWNATNAPFLFFRELASGIRTTKHLAQDVPEMRQRDPAHLHLRFSFHHHRTPVDIFFSVEMIIVDIWPAAIRTVMHSYIIRQGQLSALFIVIHFGGTKYLTDHVHVASRTKYCCSVPIKSTTFLILLHIFFHRRKLFNLSAFRLPDASAESKMGQGFLPGEPFVLSVTWHCV